MKQYTVLFSRDPGKDSWLSCAPTSDFMKGEVVNCILIFAFIIERAAKGWIEYLRAHDEHPQSKCQASLEF
jgi:hypothetical protein